MADDLDCVIVGGGMVGAALACALDPHLRVALVDRQAVEPPPARDGDYDLRVSAFNRASQRLLEHLDAWEAIVAHRVSPYTAMEVWDAEGGGRVHFDSAEVGADVLGHIIENRLVRHALWQRLHEPGRAAVHAPAAVAAIDYGNGRAEVDLEDGGRLRAALVVGADGADSRVRALAGIDEHRREYDQEAVVATVTTERSNPAIAWQRFLTTGPLAFLPLADGRSSIVWSTGPAEAARLVELPEDEFRAVLGEAFEHRLGAVTAVGRRARFTLRRAHAARYVGPRLALVGDAAHVVHPLAGQGVNLGLLDAATLAEVLLQGRARGCDLGALALLRRYERWRKGENLAMLAALDGLKRLFGASAPPLRWARSAGLSLVDRFPPAKRFFMRRAMGLEGDLPAAARAPAAGPGEDACGR